MNRRAIVQGALGGILGLTLTPFARSAFSQESPAVIPVSEGFVMLTGAGGNILVRTASTGQVLVDSGAATDAVLKRLRELPGAGHVTTVFNTHYHCSRKDPGASGDGLLPGGRGPVRESAARSFSSDRNLVFR